MRTHRMAAVCLVMGFVAAAALRAQSPSAKTEAEWKQEDSKALALYRANNIVAARPLFEELYAHQPQSLIYEESLAMCLLAPEEGESDEQLAARQARARKLLLDAHQKGDNSPLLITVLEKMDAGPSTPAPKAGTPAQARFNEAEKSFSKGDLKAAFDLYKQSLAEDPKFYLAALYAGDSAFKMNDCPTAGEYYSKAIAIDPNHETAYRYYGDCLVKMNSMVRARDMYINALLCQPYQKTTNQSLASWAQKNNARIFPPAITLPRRPEPDAKGNTNITIDPSTLADPAGPAWLVYLMSSAAWQKKEFAAHYPKETKYRHSLAEEAEALRSVLNVAKELKRTSQGSNHTLELLAALDKDGMLESWILLHDADQGIAADYGPYMLAHRELMQRYVVKYDIHAM